MTPLSSLLLAAHAAGRCDRPCQSALDWSGDRDLPTAWAENTHGAWGLWLLRQAGVRIPLEWTAAEVVAPAFDYAAGALRGVGFTAHAEALAVHAAALRGAMAETATALLAAAEDAARDAAWTVGAVGAAGTAAWAAAGAAGAAGAVGNAAGAAGAAAEDAGAAEHQRCADAVRARWPVPPPEVVALLETEHD